MTTDGKPMSKEQWVQRAVDAAVRQGFGAKVTDPAALDFIAEILARPGNQTKTT